MNWVMADQINQKDANQDQEIALLKHRIEDNEQTTDELRERVRKLEKWVWGAGAVIAAAVTLIGFGTFKVSSRAARTGRNPQTGAELKIPARNVPSFKAGAALKSSVN